MVPMAKAILLQLKETGKTIEIGTYKFLSVAKNSYYTTFSVLRIKFVYFKAVDQGALVQCSLLYVMHHNCLAYSFNFEQYN